MKSLKEEITVFREAFTQALNQVKTADHLEQVRVTYLGRNGSLTSLMKTLKELSVDERREYGPLLNTLKQETQEQFDALQQRIEQQAQTTDTTFDVTAYYHQPLRGSLHVHTHVIEQLNTIFTTMGYQIVNGPEVETDYHNFEALNIPKDHPARDMQDTFWLFNPSLLLRTHTSPMQVRTMEAQKPPMAIFAPGRVYRHEETDASHDYLFMQAEAMLIDKNVSIANLLATAKSFLRAFFEKEDISIRVRPGYFPFVEPGLEIDMSCPFCKHGCSVCKKTKWIELLGCGLIHPNVLNSSGIDPRKYTGFAMGFGLERLAMIKYGIDDIRMFHSSKIGFLNQFS